MEKPEFIAIAIILVIYACWMLLHTLLIILPKKRNKSNKISLPISIIIPFRNESQNLISLCKEILSDIYDEKTELILVDDYSENDLYSELNILFSTNPNFKIVQLREEKKGKKAALEAGHQIAGNAWRVHLDADIILPIDWYREISTELASHKPGLVAFPVFPSGSNSLLFKFEALEFLSVLTITEGGFRMNAPTMANGAQMAVHEKAFKSVNGYINDNCSSGDDVFLLHKISAQKIWECDFVFNKNLIVQFTPHNNLSSFIGQRIRWASKSVHYKNPALLFTSAIIFSGNIALIYSLINLMIYNDTYSVILLLFKGFVDLIHLIPAAVKYRSTKVLPYELLLFPVYPIYMSIILIISFVYRPQWKGRKIAL